jgi:hypothetical protein
LEQLQPVSPELWLPVEDLCQAFAAVARRCGGEHGAAIAEGLPAYVDQVDEEALVAAAWGVVGPFQNHRVAVTSLFLPGASRIITVGLASAEEEARVCAKVKAHLTHQLPGMFEKDSLYVRFSGDKVRPVV